MPVPIPSGCSHHWGYTRGCSSCSRDLPRPLICADAAVAGVPGPCLSPGGRGMTLGKTSQTSGQGAVPYVGCMVGRGTGHLTIVYLLSAKSTYALSKSQCWAVKTWQEQARACPLGASRITLFFPFPRFESCQGRLLDCDFGLWLLTPKPLFPHL